MGTIYRHDISNELQYTAAVLAKHELQETRRQAQGLRLIQASRIQRQALEEAVAVGNDFTAPMQLAVLDNETEEAAYQLSVPFPIHLDESEATLYHNNGEPIEKETRAWKGKEVKPFPWSVANACKSC